MKIVVRDLHVHISMLYVSMLVSIYSLCTFTAFFYLWLPLFVCCSIPLFFSRLFEEYNYVIFISLGVSHTNEPSRSQLDLNCIIPNSREIFLSENSRIFLLQSGHFFRCFSFGVEVKLLFSRFLLEKYVYKPYLSRSTMKPYPFFEYHHHSIVTSSNFKTEITH